MKRIIFITLFFPMLTSYSYEYPKPIEGYFSQKGQDKFLDESIFKYMKNGTFIEVGAHDGISFSNTYFFEKNRCWQGICIEPNPEIFEKLIRNRTCSCEQIGIACQTSQMPYLKCHGYITEMYSGILTNYDSRHLKRIDDEIAFYGGNKEVIFIDCMTLNDIFKKYKIEKVDLLSIDIEGGEENVIKSIDFNEITINVILVENNFEEENVRDYLLSRGYEYVRRIGKDDIYLLKKEYHD